jgi:hypothetical protein
MAAFFVVVLKRVPHQGERMFIKSIAILNVLAAVAFATLLVIGTSVADLDARSKFTQLDREGVINAKALEQFHPSYGFGNADSLTYRNTVPRWLCGSAVSFLQGNAALGFAVATMNTVLAIVAWVGQRRKRIAA